VTRPQVVVVGGGFAGFFALRHLQRHLDSDQADLVLVNPTDYLLYSPLLPEVATGVVEARHIAVSLRRLLPRVRLVLGRVNDVDLAARTVTVQMARTAGGELSRGAGLPRPRRPRPRGRWRASRG
jgi:NADH:ubiquinone reductase (H+-translocating)